MTKLKQIGFSALLLSLNISVYAGSPGVSGGLTLAETPSARPASLAEAYSAMTNDVSAFPYNPASLKSLDRGQASFMYQKGLAEDAYGHFLIGTKTRSGKGLGLSVGYYDAGTIELFDGTTTRSVSAQKDLTLGLGYASSLAGFSYGLSAKVLQSKLVDQYSATAYAADFGLQRAFGSRLNMGLAVRNLGTQLKFIEEGDPLPTSYSLGASVNLIPSHSTLLLLEAPYFSNEKELRPAVGLETMFGPLSFRAGLKNASGQNEFTVGTGFALGSSNLDYAFGLVKDLSSEHRISFSFRFGNAAGAMPEIVAKPSIRREVIAEKVTPSSEKSQRVESQVFETTSRPSLGENSRDMAKAATRRVYVVKSGDTLGRIAKKYYGDARMWKNIYAANKHLLPGDASLEVGQKIILP